MKVGIITFHKVNNVGAVLQSMALQNYVNNNICSCELIDFIPNNQVPKQNNINHLVLHIAKSAILFLRFYKNKKKENNYIIFRNKYMRLSSKTYYGDKEILENPPVYDLFISGSDQIFNISLSGGSKSYYLSFTNKRPKMSYASSFGRSKISQEELLLLKKELPSFRAISCREKNAIDIIKKETGLPASLVVDPTLLLNELEWSTMVSKVKLPKKFIFVYAMEYSEALKNFISIVKKEKGLAVYTMTGGKSAEKLQGIKCYTFGPSEFLYAIKNATYVITNSFHGTIFSMIFKKSFFCIFHSTRNVRLENIMELTNNSKRLVKSNNIKNSNEFLIDGETSYNCLNSIIQYSKDYITESIF